MSDGPFLETINSEGYKLIVPNPKSANDNAIWTRDTIWNRSRVLDNAGNLVSQGFGKFFNLGQGPLDLQIGIEDIVRAVHSDRVVATLKIDGSLLVISRYQQEGKEKPDIWVRTRGSFGCNIYNKYELEMFKEKYPKIWDHEILYYHLLFEWVSPRNQIILRYPEPELFLVGAVKDINGLEYVKLEELQQISKTLEVTIFPWFYLRSTQEWEKLYNSLETNNEIEGFVIRLKQEQKLVKVKSPVYLRKHTLKMELNEEAIIDLWFFWGKQSFEEFAAKFKHEFDEEIAIYFFPEISKMFDSIRECTKIVEHITQKVQAMNGKSRKDIALAMQSDYGTTLKFGIAMNLVSGKPTDELLKKLIKQNRS